MILRGSRTHHLCEADTAGTGQILPELMGQRNAALHRASGQSLQHPIDKNAGWGETLGYKHQLAQKGPEIMDVGGGFVYQVPTRSMISLSLSIGKVTG